MNGSVFRYGRFFYLIGFFEVFFDSVSHCLEEQPDKKFKLFINNKVMRMIITLLKSQAFFLSTKCSTSCGDCHSNHETS